MSVHEKIRFVRLAKGWTQEYLAENLEMSVNGYGDLERGKNDIKLSKLEQTKFRFRLEHFQVAHQHLVM